MPGFSLTFILLCLAGGWSRYLTSRAGASWPMLVPGIGLALWGLCLVGGMVAAMGFVPGSSGELSLGWMLTAAEVSRWITMLVLVGMVPVTIVAWQRPAVAT